MDLRTVARPPETGVPASLLDDAATLTHALEALSERFPDAEHVTILNGSGDEQRCTVGELHRNAQRARALMEEQGLRPGRMVVLALDTGLDLVAGYMATLFAGGVPALVAPPSNRIADLSLYREHLGGILANAQAAVLYCSPQVAAIFRGDAADHLHGAVTATPEERPAAGLEGVVPARPGDVATVQYSSGSTGAPKGVQLTHSAIITSIRQVRDRWKLDGRSVSVNWAPLYHDMGLMEALLLPLLSGAPTVLVPTMEFVRQPSLWLWAIHHYRGVTSYAPNFAYSLCAKRIPDAEIEGLDLSDWRIAALSAEPVLAETLRAFHDRFEPHGFRWQAFCPAYGMAEYVTGLTLEGADDDPVIDRLDRPSVARGFAKPSEDPDAMECVGSGYPLPDSEFEIRDEDGRPLAEREIGIIWFRGACLFQDYRGDPERTGRTIQDGWFRSDDRGYRVGDRLFFVSREHDLIVMGGQKYAPQDLESLVNGVPGVREGCAVAFGVLNEQRGTEDLAIVTESRESEPEGVEKLRRAIRAQVMSATGLGVRYLLVVPPGGVEKTTSGKLARGATRERYRSELS